MESCAPLEMIASYLARVSDVLAQVDLRSIELLAQAVSETGKAKGTIFTFGNGGSGATALHFANNLLDPARGLKFRVNCLLSNVSIISALANDSGYDSVYSEQLSILASPGDLAIAISASGNSTNCINGLKRAREMGAVTACLVGFDGGQLGALSDYSVHVSCDSYPLIEDVHLVIAHSIVSTLTIRSVADK
jgi:D-sedoheptulose 7-phosphate isomerase